MEGVEHGVVVEGGRGVLGPRHEEASLECGAREGVRRLPSFGSPVWRFARPHPLPWRSPFLDSPVGASRQRRLCAHACPTGSWLGYRHHRGDVLPARSAPPGQAIRRKSRIAASPSARLSGHTGSGPASRARHSSPLTAQAGAFAGLALCALAARPHVDAPAIRHGYGVGLASRLNPSTLNGPCLPVGPVARIGPQPGSKFPNRRTRRSRRKTSHTPLLGTPSRPSPNRRTRRRRAARPLRTRGGCLGSIVRRAASAHSASPAKAPA